MLFWFTFVGFTLIMGVIGVFNQSTNPLMLIVPLIMIGFGIGLVHYGFNSQKDKSINDLKRVINGQLIQ
jgi:disulfide bond formation protein DsbB